MTVGDASSALARTDVSGLATLDPGDGTRRVIVQANGYRPMSATVRSDVETVVELTEATRIDVRVTTSDGTPLPDCTIMLSDRSVRPWVEMPNAGAAVGDRGVAVWSARSDASGLATLEAVPVAQELAIYAYREGMYPVGAHGTGNRVSAPTPRIDIVMDDLKGMLVAVDSDAKVVSSRWIFDRHEFDATPAVNVWSIEMAEALRKKYPDSFAFVRQPLRGEPKVKFAVRMADGAFAELEWTVQPVRDLTPVFLTPERTAGLGQAKVVLRAKERTIDGVPLKLVASEDDPGIPIASGDSVSVPAGHYRVVPASMHFRQIVENNHQVEVTENSLTEAAIALDSRPLRIRCSAVMPSPALRSPVSVAVVTSSRSRRYFNWCPDAPLEVWCDHDTVSLTASAAGCEEIQCTLTPATEAETVDQEFVFRLAQQ
ncbi:MAG: hypothetical protein R3F56_08955 [Planctomycetota bacterium]